MDKMLSRELLCSNVFFFFVIFNEKLDSTFKFISSLYNPNNFLTIEHKTFQLSFSLGEKYLLSK